jgi:hypothetical protein
MMYICTAVRQPTSKEMNLHPKFLDQLVTVQMRAGMNRLQCQI